MPPFLLEFIKRKSMAKKRKRRHKKRILKGKYHADWSSLPQDINEMIVDKLCLVDRLSLSKTCRSWNAFLGEDLPGWQTHGLPWLLVSGEQCKEDRTCISILDNRVWELKLSEAYDKYCWGSFQEWLIMVKEMNSFILEIMLLNPFTRSQITLPPIWNFYHKIVLSGRPFENDFMCMLLHSQHRELAFYMPRIQSWLKHKMTGEPFEDAVFCKGSFFLLDGSYNIWQIDTKSICSSASKGDVHFGTLPELEIHFHEMKMLDMMQLNVVILERNDEHRILRYLVESCGEVLLVCRYFHPKQDLVLETQKFEVFSLDLCQSSWKKVEDLKDRMLFIGKCCSSSFSIEELGVGISNSIYFTNDQAAPWWNEWDSNHLKDISTRLGLVKNVGRDWGNFKLGNEDGEPFSFRGDIEKWSYTWFTAPIWWYCKNVPPIESI
ncbi:uncharacterized protein LOC114750115 [Neltuma alba]|uniref:uncharacterized protein LOC114750115 n=1 Tax=Neltuma alba TaxID=207710 RepID=UPI0010A55988|nr:uncharacterized protein LOC114750115 [Prosopis alba]